MDGVVILNDAANLDVGKGEGLSLIFQPPSFIDHFFENFSIKIDNRTIRVNCSCSYAGNVVKAMQKWNLDIGVISPFYCKDLDSVVILFES